MFTIFKFSLNIEFDQLKMFEQCTIKLFSITHHHFTNVLENYLFLHLKMHYKYIYTRKTVLHTGKNIFKRFENT